MGQGDPFVFCCLLIFLYVFSHTLLPPPLPSHPHPPPSSPPIPPTLTFLLPSHPYHILLPPSLSSHPFYLFVIFLIFYITISSTQLAAKEGGGLGWLGKRALESDAKVAHIIALEVHGFTDFEQEHMLGALVGFLSSLGAYVRVCVRVCVCVCEVCVCECIGSFTEKR